MVDSLELNLTQQKQITGTKWPKHKKM